MDKPYLSANTKLDESALEKLLLDNLNNTYCFLLQFEQVLPDLAKDACFGDLENAIDELLTEVKLQISRLLEIFNQLGAKPNNENNDIEQSLSNYNTIFLDESKDNLLTDLSIVFFLKRILSIEKSYFSTLKLILGSLNDIHTKQSVQYCLDECEDNLIIFVLIAKEYMESNINNFLN